VHDHADADLARAQELLRGARRIVALTGAGISTDSGIPDFRGPEGLWTKDPGAEMLATYDAWVGDPEVRRRGWQARLRSPLATAEPNDGHRALVRLVEEGRLALCVTQNIDGLHQLAGLPAELVVEIHGNNRQSICLACGERLAMEETLARVVAGEGDPTCRRCGGMLKSATISFGQALVAADLERADLAARDCDLMVAIGTTLTVYPVAGLVPIAHAHSAPVVIINNEPTPMDHLAEVVLRRDISSTLSSLVG
jgi:NAD-dependent deacetylase